MFAKNIAIVLLYNPSSHKSCYLCTTLLQYYYYLTALVYMFFYRSIFNIIVCSTYAPGSLERKKNTVIWVSRSFFLTYLAHFNTVLHVHSYHGWHLRRPRIITMLRWRNCNTRATAGSTWNQYQVTCTFLDYITIWHFCMFDLHI